MRKILISCIGIFYSLLLYGNDITYVIVRTHSGKEYVFNLSDGPKASINGDNVVIKNSTFEVVCPVSEGVSISFGNKESLDIEADYKDSSLFTIKDNELYCEGINPMSNIYLFSLDGRQLECKKANYEGKATLLLNEYNHQILVVKTSNKSFKIFRK